MGFTLENVLSLAVLQLKEGVERGGGAAPGGVAVCPQPGGVADEKVGRSCEGGVMSRPV